MQLAPTGYRGVGASLCIVEEVTGLGMKTILWVFACYIVVNLFVVVLATGIEQCDTLCTNHSAVVRFFIDVGLVFPRVAAYRNIQELSSYRYPWTSLAFSYGVLGLLFIVVSSVTWCCITMQTVRVWARTYDFSRQRRDTQNPATIRNVVIIVCLLIGWGTSFNTTFVDIHHSTGRIGFSIYGYPAIASPFLYLLSSFVLALVIRMYFIRKHRDKQSSNP